MLQQTCQNEALEETWWWMDGPIYIVNFPFVKRKPD